MVYPWHRGNDGTAACSTQQVDSLSLAHTDWARWFPSRRVSKRPNGPRPRGVRGTASRTGEVSLSSEQMDPQIYNCRQGWTPHLRGPALPARPGTSPRSAISSTKVRLPPGGVAMAYPWFMPRTVRNLERHSTAHAPLSALCVPPARLHLLDIRHPGKARSCRSCHRQPWVSRGRVTAVRAIHHGRPNPFPVLSFLTLCILAPSHHASFVCHV